MPPDGYQAVRDNHVWRDHELRLLTTAGAIAWLEPRSVADPACGDASIEIELLRLRNLDQLYLGDISAPQIEYNQRAAELNHGRTHVTHRVCDAIDFLDGLVFVDVVVLTEILEHVEDPESILRAARGKASHLVASSPLGEKPEHNNHEHVWSWDKDDYRAMLVSTGWRPIAYQELSFDPPFYTFQLWVCE